MMRKDLIITKNLWDVTSVVQTTLEEWQGTLWNDINTGMMEEESKRWRRRSRRSTSALRTFNAYEGVDTLLKNFLVTLPAVSDLRSPSMRERHWKLLMTITGVEFEMGPKFALADLTALQLHKFVDDVGEVVDRATKEDKMEQTLAKLAVTWKTVEFEFDQHRDTDVYLMRMKEEDFETLEDNQLVVQGMMASKYLATFEKEVTGWQKKLGNVSEVLAQMSEVQRKWAYLETLFIGSEEVKKELPESTQRFVGIDKTFRATLGAIHKIKNAVAATDVEGQQKTLEAMAGDLELCEKDLADFLESKRRSSRVRYTPQCAHSSARAAPSTLSHNPYSLPITHSVSTRLRHVPARHPLERQPAVGRRRPHQQHPAGRQVAHAYRRAEDQSHRVSSSNEGEVLDAEAHGPAQAAGQGRVLPRRCDRQGARRDARADGRRDQGLQHDRPQVGGRVDACASEWLSDHLGQLCIVVTQWAWTRDVEIAFDNMGLGQRDAMKDYNKKQIEMMNDLIMLVQDRGLEKNRAARR